MRSGSVLKTVVAGAFALLALAPAGAGAQGAQTQMRGSFDPVYELSNFEKTKERARALTLLPDYQAPLRAKGNLERWISARNVLRVRGAELSGGC